MLTERCRGGKELRATGGLQKVRGKIEPADKIAHHSLAKFGVLAVALDREGLCPAVNVWVVNHPVAAFASACDEMKSVVVVLRIRTNSRYLCGLGTAPRHPALRLDFLVERQRP